MKSTNRLAKVVHEVLKARAIVGVTTKQEATVLTMRKIEKAGGPTKFGIGAAELLMALQKVVGTEVVRQLKATLSDHAAEFVLPKYAVTEILKEMGRIPEWIALGEGNDARWVPSLKATQENWLANAALKETKAFQTTQQANFSRDIALYLQKNRLRSLEEILTTPASGAA